MLALTSSAILSTLVCWLRASLLLPRYLSLIASRSTSVRSFSRLNFSLICLNFACASRSSCRSRCNWNVPTQVSALSQYYFFSHRHQDSFHAWPFTAYSIDKRLRKDEYFIKIGQRLRKDKYFTKIGQTLRERWVFY